jgi:hypothetical protein
MNEEQKMIPYYVHEGEMARQERHIKRLWILCLVIFLALVGTNAGWIIYESQYQDVVITETKQDGAGVNIVSGKDVMYGADNQENPSQGEEERQSE